jgi:GT2 family glycosyltransferase
VQESSIEPERPGTVASRARPAATVLVCTRSRGELLLGCFEAIVKALGPSDELLVVEAESDSARAAVTSLGDARCNWLRAQLPGKSRQLNQGIAAARNGIVLITDDDCRVPTGWVDAMVAPFLEPDVGITFGPVDGLTRIAGAGSGNRFPAGPAPAEGWAYSHGAAMAVRRTAALQVGGFDKRFGPGTPVVGGEEADTVLRMEAAGWRCWLAEAPPVEHQKWRTDEQELRNLLAYERAGGAWVGAALRRDPWGAARAIETRLRYQAGHFRSPAPRAFAVRAQAAFCAGVVTGLRFRPPQPRSQSRRPPLPWPSLRDKRCLVLAADDGVLAAELERRGVADAVWIDPAALDERTPGELGPVDVVIALDLLAQVEDPVRALRTIRSICGSHFLSVEPIGLLRSILTRGRPRAILNDRARAGTSLWALTGAAHRQLVQDAGFEIQTVSRPFVVDGKPPAAGATRAWLRAALQRPLTGNGTPGIPHRALLARPPD